MSLALGRAVSRARKKAGLTQQQLSRRLKLSESTVAKIEQGVITAPSAFTVAQIARLTRTRLDDLIRGRVVSLTPVEPVPVKLVYWSVLGTLTGSWVSLGPVLANLTSLPQALVQSIWWRYWPAWALGQIRSSDLARHFDLEPDFDWPRFLADYLPANKAVCQLLTATSQKLAVGLLTNLPLAVVEALIGAGKLPELKYQNLITPQLTACLKPNQKFYDRAGQLAQCPDQQILLIDDCGLSLSQARLRNWQTLASDPNQFLVLQDSLDYFLESV